MRMNIFRWSCNTPLFCNPFRIYTLLKLRRLLETKKQNKIMCTLQQYVENRLMGALMQFELSKVSFVGFESRYYMVPISDKKKGQNTIGDV